MLLEQQLLMDLNVNFPKGFCQTFVLVYSIFRKQNPSNFTGGNTNPSLKLKKVEVLQLLYFIQTQLIKPK